MTSANRILFIGSDASRTGAPLLFLHFLRWLRVNSDLEFDILLRSGGELLADYRELGAVRVLEDNLSSPTILARVLRRLRRKLGFAPDNPKRLQKAYPLSRYPLIYSNTATNCATLETLSVPGRKIICHAHELDYAVHCHGGADSLTRSVRHTTQFIAASSAVASFLEHRILVPQHKIKVIHEFAVALPDRKDSLVEARRNALEILGIPINTRVVGMCGGAGDWRKGADLFIQLALHLKRIPGANPLRLVWLGGKDKSERLQQELCKADLLDTVLFAGTTPRPELVFPAFDVFALTSREEPFSVAMLEAAACGVPVVCFENAGGGPEFVGSDNGVAVPYLDIPAMAEACALLLGDVSLRNRLGNNAQVKVKEQLSVDKIAPQLLATIQKELTDPGLEVVSYRKSLESSRA